MHFSQTQGFSKNKNHSKEISSFDHVSKLALQWIILLGDEYIELQ